MSMLKTKKTSLITVVALCSSLLMTSCSTPNPNKNQDIGTVAGGVIGGLIGSQFGSGMGQVAAAAGGAVVGAYLGSKIGQSMDKTDQLAAQQALNSSKSTTWTNPNSGNTYTVTPQKTYTASNNQTCRQYTTTGVIDGKKQTLKGTACLMSDGTWKPVS